MYKESNIKIEENHKEVPFKNIKECLQEHAKLKSETEAFIFVSTDGGRQSVTWSELYDRCCTTARSMINLGVQRREIVAVNVRTCPEWLYATFGAMIAGAMPVSISFTYTDGSDLISMMEKLECCSLLVMDPGLDNVNWNIIQKLLDESDSNGRIRSKSLKHLRYLVGVKFEDTTADVKDFKDLLQNDNADIALPDIDPDDVVMMFQTSGSTGIPKFVVHTHASLLSIARTNLDFTDPRHVLLNERPFSWLGGFPLSVLTGQMRVTVSGFCSPPANRSPFIKEIIMKERCTSLVALPPVLAELIRTQDDLPNDWPLEEVVTGSQPLTKIVVQCIGKLGKLLCCLYASSEALFLTQALVTDRKSFTEYGCGTPLKLSGVEMKVVDENGLTVPVHTRGELFIRSPGMFKEYFNDPEKTKASMSAGGWYRTDDIAQMTETGEFLIEGRKSNMIISGGMTVSPEILEHHLKAAPGVESVVIVPVPDEIYFQVLCACFVRKPGSDITEDQVRRYCETFHADKSGLFTVLPKYYMFFEKFPETKTGKTNRKEIESIARLRFLKK